MTVMLASLLTMVIAQAASQGAGAQISARQMEDMLLKTDPAAALTDLPARVMDVGGENVGVAIARRTKSEVNALVHHKITEVYVIRSGSGTMLTGGRLVGAKESNASPVIGPSATGTGIDGGVSRRVVAGDVVILPPGTPHMFTALDGDIVYLIIRVDPSHLLSLK